MIGHYLLKKKLKLKLLILNLHLSDERIFKSEQGSERFKGSLSRLSD